MGKQTYTLHGIAHPTAQFGQALVVERCAEYADLPTVRTQQAVQVMQQRRLAAAALAEYGGRLPRREIQRDTVEHQPAAQPFRDCMQAYRGRHLETPTLAVTIGCIVAGLGSIDP